MHSHAHTHTRMHARAHTHTPKVKKKRGHQFEREQVRSLWEDLEGGEERRKLCNSIILSKSIFLKAIQQKEKCVSAK